MAKTITRIAIVGVTGRLGARIEALAGARPDVQVTAALSRAHPDPAQDIDVVIDVAGAAGARRAIDLAERLGASLLQASTGLEARDEAATDALAGRFAVLVAPNLSPGVAVLRHLVGEAVRHLPAGWTVDIVEAHHRGKVDAPSGTARALAESAGAAGRPVPGDRIHSIRAGSIVGEHEMILAGPMEIIRLRHEAGSRDVFAAGALDAARWLHGRPAGRYAMSDVLASD